ncbi:MAG: ribonuclease J [Synergistaceae bacterium]|nr:ribonuclease J [Synergistaceae bacterium]
MTLRSKEPRSSHSTKRLGRDTLSYIPLGGLGEIGKNMYAVEYNNNILVIDAGLMFPDSELPGIDYIVPDISYLEANREKVLAVIITHGHEDHTGALAYMLQRLNIPVYGTRLTLGLINSKLQEDLPLFKPDFHEIKAGEIIEIGDFKIRFIAVAHSIPDGVALSIETPLGRIVHTGDFKLDSTPIDGRITDYGAFAEEGDKGVLLLASDSTNAERKGFTPSEKIIGATLDQLFRIYKSRRIIVSSFASNVHRVQQVVDAAVRFNRKIAFLGRSMIKNVEIARELGYLKLDLKMLVNIENINKVNNNNLVIMTTGSQGEPFSGLVTMSRGENRSIKLGARDAVFILASIIPGNEKLVNNTINRLFALGCEVVYEQEKNTHVSGHASAEELKIILNLVKPQYFVPVHGEYKHLVRHSQLAQEVGVPPRNIFILSNGDVLNFTRGAKPKIKGQVANGTILVDGKAMGGISNGIMKERRELAEDGVLVVAAALDDAGNLLAPIAIETQGVFIPDDKPDPNVNINHSYNSRRKIKQHKIYASLKEQIFDELKIAAEKAIRESKDRHGVNIETVSRNIKSRVRDVLKRRNSSFAVVMPVISVNNIDYSHQDFFNI